MNANAVGDLLKGKMNHAYNKALLIVLKESQNVTFFEHELMDIWRVMLVLSVF